MKHVAGFTPEPPAYRGPKLRTVDGETEKLCGRCREWWPADLEFFFADPTRASGLFYCCKACYSEWKTANAAKKSGAPAPTATKGPQ